jgi:hypothetical protein
MAHLCHNCGKLVADGESCNCTGTVSNDVIRRRLTDLEESNEKLWIMIEELVSRVKTLEEK